MQENLASIERHQNEAGVRLGRFTCTMPRVAEVTGSEKSPPGGDTLQAKKRGTTCWSEPFRSGGLCRPPVDKARRYLRSDDADAALPLGVAQTLHPPGSLVEGGETGAKVCGITTVCGRTAEERVTADRIAQCFQVPDSSFQRRISIPSYEIRVKAELQLSNFHSSTREGFNFFLKCCCQL